MTAATRDRVVLIPTDEGWESSALFQGAEHLQRDTCPGCKREDLRKTALVELAYVFTACECDVVDYRHLYEQLWHLRCLTSEGAALP